ncbi:4-diphosphocytidyl-2C-methyl-D-erythritol synthase [Aurantiacibacter spongiae]|uniref:4-diphosphocytidyl-2C-methyl-D-erythritol synthase n=2 Tax=Aurantiacibacter spongiae TaxID=2488860 RepID=A0A3N5DCP0_9SPHN|nr:4-diphosphocytidyl-2C-methyl-D-erythritol synthase [Aurantiacibacter spongiae]
MADGAQTPARLPPCAVLVLAGTRPGGDPLLKGSPVPTKALLPIAGKPMLTHVLRAVLAAQGLGPVTVAAQDIAALRSDPAINCLAARVEWRSSSDSLAATVAQAVRDAEGPLLVTTADNVLLTSDILGEFLDGAGDADLAVGAVERSALARAGIGAQRTWLKFRGGAWSGANLFLLGGRHTLPLIEEWGRVEQQRKKGRAVIGLFGPALLVGAGLRLLSIHDFATRAGRRFGLGAKVVPLSRAEACIDADKPDDIVLIEKIMMRRAQARE